MDPNNPYAALELDTDSTTQYSAAFVGRTGIVSLLVLLYCGGMHCALLIGTAMGMNFLSRLMTPALGVVHATVCIGGAVVAMLFIRHAFQNKSLSKRARFLWLLALGCGYGLFFYWAKHIRPGSRA